MGLIVGNEQNVVTLSIDGGDYTQENAYVSIQPEIAFDRDQNMLRFSVKVNKTKQDKLDGKKRINTDDINPMYTLPCTVAELDAETGNALFVVAYAKLKAKLLEKWPNKVFDDLP